MLDSTIHKTLKFQWLSTLKFTSFLLHSYILVFELLYEFARVAVTIYHEPSGLNSKTLLFHSSEG